MGADQFLTLADGATAGEAFNAAVSEAQWEHGHGGYTGTIAEKSGYVVVPLPDDVMSPEDFADLIGTPSDRVKLAELVGETQAGRLVELYENKWGPAVAVDYGHGSWLFFGLASC